MMKFILPILLMCSYSASFACDQEEGSAEMKEMSCNHEEGKTCDCMKKKGHGAHAHGKTKSGAKSAAASADVKSSEKPVESGK